MPNIAPAGKLRWYQTWYGLALAGLLTLIIVAGIIFAILAGRYYWLIKHGQGEALYQKFRAEEIAQIDPMIAALRQRLESAERPFLGDKNAPVTIVEFVDFKCPFCKQAVPIMYQLVKQFPNKVKIIFRHFPLETVHPGAEKLSMVAYCADQQGMFWPMHNVIFEKQEQLSDVITAEEISALAAGAGINETILDNCLKNPATLTAVRADFADGVFAGAKATPTFFVNGEKAEGVIPFAVWEGFLKNFSAKGGSASGG